MNELTPQEEQLMRFIWQYGKGFVKVTFFASEEKLSERDLEEILEMIKNKK